ncbi:hypothetical protein DMENIID0001_079970 [Sergentomyia squamirostris]
MGDSDSGISSVSSGRTTSSVCGDDRSTAGSRSSAASLSLSEVSSPTPSSSSTSSSSSQHQEPVKVWRDPLTVDGGPQVRHVQSVQHHSLMMTPAGHPFQPLSSHVSLLLPPPIYPPELWNKQPVGQRFDEEKLVRTKYMWYLSGIGLVGGRSKASQAYGDVYGVVESFFQPMRRSQQKKK